MMRTAWLCVLALCGCSGSNGATADARVPVVLGELTNEGSTMMEDVRIAEGGISNLMTDVLLEAARAELDDSIDFVVLNGGAIRGGADISSNETARIGNTYGPGDLTDVDVEGWFPFNDDHVVMTLNGAQIKRALEHAVSTFADDARTTFGADLENDAGGPFLHPAGLTYEATCPGTVRLKVGPTDCDPFAGGCHYINPDDADTITKIAIGGTVIYDHALGGWQKGGDTATFRVAMNDFLASGNDNHLDFHDGTDRRAVPRSEFDYTGRLKAYIQTHSPLTLQADQDRIVVNGAVDGLPCNLPASCTPLHKPTHPNCAHLR